MRSILLGAASLSLLLLNTLSVPAGEKTEAEALVQRLIEHMRINTPVAGEFEVHGTFDKVLHEKKKSTLEHQANERLGGRASFHLEPDEHLHLCRWAYSRNEEMMETLPGSKNAFKTMFLNREASLVGFEKSSFNLDKQMSLGYWRPGSFYFLSGSDRWEDLLPKYSGAALVDLPANAPENSVCVSVKKLDAPIEFRLLVDRGGAVLHGYDAYSDGKLVVRMRIHEFVRGPDHRFFPKRAEILVFAPEETSRPYRTERLTAKSVSFPNTQSQTSDAFSLILPKGTLIADRQLNRSMTLEHPTPVREVLEGRIPSKPLVPQTENLSQHLKAEPNRIWYWIAGGGLGVVVLGVALVLLRRRVKK